LYGKSKNFAQVLLKPYLADGSTGQPCPKDVSLLFTNTRLASGNAVFSCETIDDECAKGRNFGEAQESYRSLALKEAEIRKLTLMAKPVDAHATAAAGKP
jgi:hypothetical protein